MIDVVYFSSVSGQTERFVNKLGLDRVHKIPLTRGDGELTVSSPYILITPTYGAGNGHRPVPPQVVKFLNNEQNRSLLRGVIASGNLNFGPDFCKAGDIVAAKCGVPYLYRFELMGTDHDVRRVQEGLEEFERTLRHNGRWESVA